VTDDGLTLLGKVDPEEQLAFDIAFALKKVTGFAKR
jgi:hypothetical protein